MPLSSSILLPTSLLAPIIVIMGLAYPRMRGLFIKLAPWTALPALLAATIPTLEKPLSLPWVFLNLQLHLDQTGRLFLGVSALVWLLAGLHAYYYLHSDKHRLSFVCAFLASMTGNFGLIMAADAVSFYSFFALMSFASYPLIVHDRSKEAYRAGLVYLVLVILGEALVFWGLIESVSLAEGSRLDLIRDALSQSESGLFLSVILLIGFGIKAGVAPLHVWLPLAHPVAPTPASAVLSGCMIKAGLLGWIRFLPLGKVAFNELVPWLLSIGVISVLGGLLIGLSQNNPKTLLAYSSISKMGTMLLLIAVGFSSPGAWPALLTALSLYAAFHTLNKGALFLGCSVTPHMVKGSWAARLVWLNLVILVFSFAGVPLLAGAAAKSLFKATLGDIELQAQAWLSFALSAASFLTVLIMGRFVLLTLPDAHKTKKTELDSITLIWLCSGIVVLFSPYIVLLFGYEELLAQAYSWQNLFKGQWPLIAAVVFLSIYYFFPWRFSLKVYPGDLLYFYEAIIRRLTFLLRIQPRPLESGLQKYAGLLSRRIYLRLSQQSLKLENNLVERPAGGLFFLLILALVFIALFR